MGTVLLPIFKTWKIGLISRKWTGISAVLSLAGGPQCKQMGERGQEFEFIPGVLGYFLCSSLKEVLLGLELFLWGKLKEVHFPDQCHTAK